MQNITRSRAPQARRLRTRQRILDAARARIAEEGFEQCRTQDVANDAGVSEGTVFSHFGTKQGLLVGLMEDHYQQLEKDACDIVSRVKAPEDKLGALIRFHLDRLLQSWELVRVFAHYGRFSKTPVAATFVRLNRSYVRLFQDCLDNLKKTGHIDPDLPSDLLRDMIFGGAEHWALRVKELDQPLGPDRAARFLLGRVLCPVKNA